MKIINKTLNDYKYIVFLDFEGTQTSQEIIAIGAIKVKLDAKNHITKVYPGFKKYVTAKNEIGPIVVKLTGIDEELLKNEGIHFLIALKELEKYVGKDDAKFFVYGNYDMHLLHSTAINYEANDFPFIQNIYKNKVDFSIILSKFVRSNKNTQLSLVDALRVFEENIDPNQHDPLSDSINLMNLYEAFITKKNILKKEYEKVLTSTPNLPTPYIKITKKLLSEEKVTYKDFQTYIEEDLK